jgi:hypothetical protein
MRERERKREREREKERERTSRKGGRPYLSNDDK